MQETTLTKAEAQARLVRRASMVPCRLAFIDCKMPGSEKKENYSLIGAGVTQSAEQVVNLTDPHGFSLGVAAMPPGTVNNLHVHYTAEVFMVFKGTWTFRWGANGDEGEVVGRAGDVVSIPTWIFRGFTNSGQDDGWIFTALGGDDTGGILWHPSILENAARHGLYLTRDNMLVDTEAGAPKPAPEALIRPMTQADITALPRYSPAEMASRMVTTAQRNWSDRALLDSHLPGHASRIAPVLGHGISQDATQLPPIRNPHGLAIEWLRIEPGNQVGPFMLPVKQALIVFKGAARVTLNAPDKGIALDAASQELVSVPENVWRSIACAGSEPVEIAVLTAGNGPAQVTWWPALAEAALAKGVGIDHAGYLAPAHLLPAAQAAA
jgi:mannose-6-phosphate isomerase-like protein (cupin superfamily)